MGSKAKAVVPSARVVRVNDDDDNDDEVTIHAKHVNYKLNKDKAIHKKIVSCDRDTHNFEIHDSHFIGQFNTAAFELFRNDLMAYITECKQYVYQLSEMKEVSGKITQDTIYVKENPGTDIKFEDLPKFFTISVYRTKDKIMVNGPGFKRFVSHDLPVLTGNIENVTDILSNANGQIKKSLLTQAKLGEVDGTLTKRSDKLWQIENPEENVCPIPVENGSEERGGEGVDNTKRNRKKKAYDGYEMNINLPKISASRKLSVDSSSVEDKEWNAKPKYWDKYGSGEWTDEIAKQCNKRKGCLKQCGKNNSSEMICCDGCGKWCHFKCRVQSEFEEDEDYICFICNGKVVQESVTESSVLGVVVEESNSADSDDPLVISEKIVDVSLGKQDTTVVKIPAVNEGMSVEMTNVGGDPNSLEALSVEVTEMQNIIVTKPKLDSCDIKSYISGMIEWYNETSKKNIGRDHKYLQYELQSVSNEITVSYYNSGQDTLRSVGTNELDTAVGCMTFDMQDLTKIREKESQLLSMIKGTKNENLYAVIMRQKDKICELKMQLAEPSLPTMVVNHITFLAAALVEKETRVREYDMKNKEAKLQIAELKSSKKRFEDQLSRQKVENETAKASIAILQKQVGILQAEKQEYQKEMIEIGNKNDNRTDLENENEDLKKQLAKLTKENSTIEKNKQELEAKLEVLRLAQTDIKPSNELENTTLKDANTKLKKKISDLVRESTVMKDQLQEEKSKYENVDNFYSSIIENKDKTIAKYLEISSMPLDSDNKFRRLLSYHKAEKEMQAMTRLSEQLLENDGQIVSRDKDEVRNEASSDIILVDDDQETAKDIQMKPDEKLMEYIKSSTVPGAEKEEELNGNGKKTCWFGHVCFRSTCKFEHGASLSPPNCRFKMKCTRRDCVFSHPDDCTTRVGCTDVNCTKRHIIRAQMRDDIDTASTSRVDKREEVLCRRGLTCSRNGCVFKHANDCLTRRNCQIIDCKNRHIDKSFTDGNRNESGETGWNDGVAKISSEQVHYDEISSQRYPVKNADGIKDNNKLAGMDGMRYQTVNSGFYPSFPFFPPPPDMLNWMNMPGMFQKNVLSR